MRYEGIIYRPPSEADSLVIQATIGCPHNACHFCNMYRDRSFRIRRVEEIIEDLNESQKIKGHRVKSIFLSDGNSILMKTADLIRILNKCYELFPSLERVTLYGSAQYINLKNEEDFIALKEAGLTRIHSGMESGSEEVLALHNKGFTHDKMMKAGNLVKNAGIELSLYYIIGLGGKSLTKNHAKESALLINKINPDFIRLRTLLPLKGTTLKTWYQSGEFHLLTGHEAIEETILLIEGLRDISSLFLSDHISNHFKVSGRFPADKKKLLSELKAVYELDASCFRPADSGCL